MASHAKGILRQVRDAAVKRILFLPHAISQMKAPERMIATWEVRGVVFEGTVIEDYQKSARHQLSDAWLRR